MSLGAVYEQDSLLGTYGTGHFQIQDGYSSGARLDWIHRLSHHVEHANAHVGYYDRHCSGGTPWCCEFILAYASQVFLVSLERTLISYNDMATSRLQMSISCNTGTRGSFNSFGTPM